jgi:hypothetical protein
MKVLRHPVVSDFRNRTRHNNIIRTGKVLYTLIGKTLKVFAGEIEMRFMVAQSRQESKTIPQIIMDLMMVLLIVFLVASPSAIAAGTTSGADAESFVPTNGPGAKIISPASSSKLDDLIKDAIRITPCATECTEYVKRTDHTDTNTKTEIAYSFTMLGKTFNLYMQYNQTHTTGHYIRTCTPMARCSVNLLCEKSGEPYTQEGEAWEEVGEWVITGYWLDPDPRTRTTRVHIEA